MRVTQTGTAAALWSVGEINLFNDTVLYNGTHTATASSTAGGTTTGMALDGNVATVWQSGVAQVPGQTFTIDLGRNVDMDKVLFDAGAATANDYPRIWDVYTSWDNVTYTQVASGYGTNRVIQADFQGGKNGRYLRIVSNGTVGAVVVDRRDRDLQRHQPGPRRLGRHGIRRRDSPANMVDTNTATRWTTGAAQTHRPDRSRSTWARSSRSTT